MVATVGVTNAGIGETADILVGITFFLGLAALRWPFEHLVDDDRCIVPGIQLVPRPPSRRVGTNVGCRQGIM